MKHYTFFLLFLITVAPGILSSMDVAIALEPLADSFEERIRSSSSAINKMYKYKDPAIVLQNSLSAHKAYSIVQLVYTVQNGRINPLFLKILMEQNAFFLHAINHYYEYALKNIDQVTCDTLETVSNYLNDQPVKKLNELPSPIKKFVMKKAYAQVNYLYNINFEGHTDKIKSIATNIPSNLAASASKDGTFRLWKLSTGELLHVFDESAYEGYVNFNRDGSQLATATVYKHPRKVRIRVWDTISRQSLYHMNQQGLITHLHFFPNGKTSITMVVSKKNIQSLYILKKDRSPLHQGDITQGIKTYPEETNYAKEIHNYCWSITRNSRRLGLCAKAVYNTKNQQSLEKTTLIPIYGKLTDYEKKILKIKIDERSQALKQKTTANTLRILLG